VAGYSKKPLQEKLGLKSGFRVIFLNPPSTYLADLGELPPGLVITENLSGKFDFIHFFSKSQDELTTQFPLLKESLLPNGSLWISWPKLSAKVPSDVPENLVRDIGLNNGLVDVKVAAVDEVWSGLKFVYRLKDRP
jgi:hypothetical protein